MPLRSHLRSEDKRSQENQYITTDLSKQQATLKAAIDQHVAKEKASFHTPGHKGRGSSAQQQGVSQLYLARDLTELPGLDDLYQPTEVLSNLEKRAASLWGAHSSLLSVNGASAGLIAAIMTLAKRGSQILLPRNCHRSVVHALVLSGLEPVWFEPVWEERWNIWGAVSSHEFVAALKKNYSEKLVGALIVSPTYAGALSDLKEIAEHCHSYELPLIVDEAHGTHQLLPEAKQASALHCGADLVVHSLHKILGGLTQTGIVHISQQAWERFGINVDELRFSLNLIQSSSPSYIFLSSMDDIITALESGEAHTALTRIEQLGSRLREELSFADDLELYHGTYGSTKSHLLLSSAEPQALYDFLVEAGIYPESVFGAGLLLLIGIGSNESDINLLVEKVKEFARSSNQNLKASANRKPFAKPKPIEQAISPRSAFFSKAHYLPIDQAEGAIAAQCVAPCPPGWPVIIPGQRLQPDSLNQCNLPTVKVLVSSN